jgi:VCBS repeat-containing protein
VTGTFTAGQTATITGKGTLTIAATGAYTFTPSANWNGELPEVTYTFVDGTILTSTAKLQITLTAVNDGPTVVADTATVAEDNAVSGNVLTNDSDIEGSALSITEFTVDGQTLAAGSTATLTDKGTLSLAANGAYTFTPVANWNGTVPVLTYTVTDGTATSTSTLAITVTAVNDAATLGNDSATALEDNAATGNVLTNDSDVEGALTVSSFAISGVTGTFTAGSTATIAGNGALTIAANGAWTFTPVANWNGAVPTVTVSVNDGGVLRTSTLAIAITSVNDGPTAVADTATMLEDGAPIAGNVLTNDSDVEGTALAVTQYTVDGQTKAAGQSVTLAGKGTLTVAANGAWSFTPVANYNGAVPTLTYTVTDGTATSTSTLSITVTAVNDAPVAVADSFSFSRNVVSTGNVLSNDSDADGDALSVTTFTVTGFRVFNMSSTIVGKGTLTFNTNGTFTFTPVNGWFGTLPAITYTVSDGKVTKTASLTIKVL